MAAVATTTAARIPNMQSFNVSATGFDVPYRFNYTAKLTSESSENYKKPSKNPNQIAVDALTEIGNLYGSKPLLFEAQKLTVCGDEVSKWQADDLLGFGGELFDGEGRFRLCKSRFCDFCQSRYCAERRKVGRAFVAEAEFRRDELSARLFKKRNSNVNLRWFFLTVTIPNPDNQPITVAHNVCIRAFDYLKKRSFWMKTIAGSIRGIEYQNKSGAFFPHAHLLLFADFTGLDNELEKHWYEAVTAAWKESGIDIKLQGKSFTKLEKIPTQDVIRILNYVIKPQQFINLNPQNILALVDVQRLRRIEIGRLPKVMDGKASIKDNSTLNSALHPDKKVAHKAKAKQNSHADLNNLTPEEYGDCLRLKTRQSREQLKFLLSYRHPYAQFTSDGEKWDGISVKGDVN